MESCGRYPHVNSSPRAVAMVLALVSAIILSPLYVDHRGSESRLIKTRWSTSGLVLPAAVVGLIVAIKSTTCSFDQSADCYGFRFGSSSLGLAAILIALLFVISWQASLQQFF